MKFTCVVPSYLGYYGGAAERREEKLLRAVNAILGQTFTDFDLQVVADGCARTMEIVSTISDPRLTATLIKKAPMWDGAPRNTGIEKGKGEFIIYCDIDDCWGEDHLKIIDYNLKDYDWVYFNDYIFSDGQWIERHCEIKKLGMNGTSNICHRKSLGAQWGHRGYAHDHYFNQSLMMRSRNYAKIPTPEYFVMHLPGGLDL